MQKAIKTMLTQRERAAVEFIRAHLAEMQSMARLSNQGMLAYFIDMAAMEAAELLGNEAGRTDKSRPGHGHDDHGEAGDTRSIGKQGTLEKGWRE